MQNERVAPALVGREAEGPNLCRMERRAAGTAPRRLEGLGGAVPAVSARARRHALIGIERNR